MTRWSLDRIGDRKTAVFFTISDTTPTYNFLWPWPFRRCSISFRTGGQRTRWEAPPSCAGAVGRGSQHRTGAPA